MKTKFVKLTYDILRMEGLTSTDKIVLAYNLGMPRFFASTAHIAETLGLTKKTVEKSITKMRKLGLWREVAAYSGRKLNPPGVGADPTGVRYNPTRVGHKKSVSPMKTEPGIERILENNKKEGIESAAVAAELCDSPQTALKILESKTSVSSESQEIRNNGITESEALNRIGIELAEVAVPSGPTGRPMTKAEMAAANFMAIMNGKPEPFSPMRVADGSDGNQWLKPSVAEFEHVFGRKAV